MPLKLNSPVLDELVLQFAKLPGIGRKAALRMAIHLLESADDEVEALADAIRNVKRKISVCTICGNWTECDPCPICESPSRDRSTICVLESPADLLAVERSGYRGLYHVLGGVLSPLDDVGPEHLRLRELMKRVQDGGISEIIVATNPTAEGDVTALYIAKLLEPLAMPVTRIGFGIPVGADVRLADEVTLAHAMQSRRALS